MPQGSTSYRGINRQTCSTLYRLAMPAGCLWTSRAQHHQCQGQQHAQAGRSGWRPTSGHCQTQHPLHKCCQALPDDNGNSAGSSTQQRGMSPDSTNGTPAPAWQQALSSWWLALTWQQQLYVVIAVMCSTVACAATFGGARAGQTGGQRVVCMERPLARPTRAAGGTTSACPSSQEQLFAHPAPAAAGAAIANPATHEPPSAHSVPAAAAAAAVTVPGTQQQPVTPTAPVATGTATTGCVMQEQLVVPSVSACAAGAATAGPGDGAVVSFWCGMHTPRNAAAALGGVVSPPVLHCSAAAGTPSAPLRVQAAAGGRRAWRSACPDRTTAAPCSAVAMHALMPDAMSDDLSVQRNALQSALGTRAGRLRPAQYDALIAAQYETPEALLDASESSLREVLKHAFGAVDAVLAWQRETKQGQAGKDEVAGLTARLEQLEFKTERDGAAIMQLRFQQLQSRLSVTSASAVGRFVTEEHSRIAPREVLALLGVPVNMDAYCEELLNDPDIVKAFDAAKKSTGEPATQMLYEKLAAVANRLASPDVYACNTSGGGYPGSGKIDITVSTVPKPPTKQGSIPWTGVAGTCAVKSNINNGGDYNIVMGQLSDRAMDCFFHQPQRAYMFGLAGGADAAELSVFYKDQRFAVRTGREQLALAPNSKGLQLVAAFFMAPAAQLGYVAPSPLAWFTTTTVISHPQETWEVRAHTLLRDALNKAGSGSKSTATVWACTFSGCASGTQLDAILKLGPEAPAEADMLLRLNQAGVPNIPRLLDYGALPTGEPYLATTPVGFSVTPQTEPARILQLGRDAAQTSEAMYRLLKLLHMDYSATNILTGPGDETLVIDFGLSHRSQRAPVFSGTINFMDIERMTTGKATLSGELESILYVLLWWACNGRLRWKHATGLSATAAAKLYAMEKVFEEKVLNRCRPELKPAMRDLRNLFFTPAHNCNVSADAFIDVLNKHINALQHP